MYACTCVGVLTIVLVILIVRRVHAEILNEAREVGEGSMFAPVTQVKWRIVNALYQLIKPVKRKTETACFLLSTSASFQKQECVGQGKCYPRKLLHTCVHALSKRMQ